ncbi:MAG: TIGR00282 family metallophosphoesterase [Oscillospiraceae bacterium]
MKVLCIGDVVGGAGTSFLCRKLPSLKRELNADLCIVNGENADNSGTGITRGAADEILSHGADVITTGNHALRRADTELYTESETLLMPANYPGLERSASVCEIDFGKYRVMVANLSGVAFLEPLDNPFICADSIISASDARFKIIDFHAESTAEKKAFAYYLDGRVSAIFGTHTHVPTADEQVLPLGTGYITDVGMCGPVNSVIGVEPKCAIAKQKSHLPARFAVAEGKCAMHGVLFTLDDTSGLCVEARRVTICE